MGKVIKGSVKVGTRKSGIVWLSRPSTLSIIFFVFGMYSFGFFPDFGWDSGGMDGLVSVFARYEPSFGPNLRRAGGGISASG